MKRELVLGAIVACGMLSAVVAGRQASRSLPAEALELTKIEKVRDNLYMITGSDPSVLNGFSGGNTSVFITDAGVVLVDTKLAGWGQVLIDKVKSVTDKPITTPELREYQQFMNDFVNAVKAAKQAG